MDINEFFRSVKRLDTLPNGYKMEYSFFSDFDIAEKIGGEVAIRETYERAFKGWASNYKALTELVISLNYKIWDTYENNKHDLAKVYNELWEICDDYAMDNLKGEELDHFLRITD